MGIIFYNEPQLENPVLIAGWPGIANIGIIAVDTLREMLGAEEFGHIEPWDFFYPSKVSIKNGELVDLEFPGNKFYFKRTEKKDIIFFIGEEQPSEGGKPYSEGTKAYQMANLVLDVALKYGCQRVYTSGAAVAPIHHSMRPKVWAVPNSKDLVPEFRSYENTVLMSDIEGRGGQGNISGLNGLLLGVAQKRGLQGVSIMGEIPIYLQGFPIIYPKASKSVLEVLTAVLGISIDLREMTEIAEGNEREIDRLYEKLPLEAKEQLDKLKNVHYTVTTEPGKITEEDKKKILEDVDNFFKKSTTDGEN